MGGTPWSVNKMYLSDKPTMLVGMDVYHQTKAKKNSVLALCSTVDRWFSKYWSSV